MENSDISFVNCVRLKSSFLRIVLNRVISISLSAAKSSALPERKDISCGTYDTVSLLPISSVPVCAMGWPTKSFSKLDLPLNYIDVISRLQIETLILEYKPTMLFVEHDEAFVNDIATKVCRISLNQ